MSWSRAAAIVLALAAMNWAHVGAQERTPEVCMALPGSPACAAARSCQRAPTGRECRSGLEAQGFEAAQWAVQNDTAEAVARVGARFAAQNTDLGRRVAAREAAAARVKALDGELVGALGRAEAGGQAELRARLTAAQQELRAADDFLAAQYPAYQELARPKPLSIADTQTLLTRDEALVFYMVGPQTTYVWAITREATAWRRIPLGKAALSEKIVALREGLDPDVVNAALDAGRAPHFAFDVSRELYRLLVEPVAASLAGKSRVLIAPSGPLLGLPFAVLTASPPPAGAAALADYKAARWFGTSKALTVLPAPSALRALRCPGGFRDNRCAPRQGRPALERPFIGVGAARFNGLPAVLDAPTRDLVAACFFAPDAPTAALADQRCIPLLEPLPGSGQELSAIARDTNTAEGQGIFFGAAATERQIKEMRLRANVIVLATHGLTAESGVRTGEAGLAFTVPALQTPARAASALDDGYLTASEAAQLSIAADFVILSACDTARGRKLDDDGLSGLARSFLYAGADALLVSHWPVADAAAVTLSPTVVAYSRRMDRAAALRLVMEEMLARARDVGDAHPAYWAPFELVGA